MRKKIEITILAIALLALLVIVWSFYQEHVHQQYDLPAKFAGMPVSLQNIQDWKTCRNELYGFEIKYPENYFLCQHSVDRISLRQNTTSEEECRTAGKRIGLHVYRLGQVTGIGLGSYSIQLTQDTTVEDIAQQFLPDDNRSMVRVLRTCHPRKINGNDAIVCTITAPGEMPWLTGGIFEVFVLSIYETKDGERILVKVSNDAGGTPHKGDRALRRDVLRVFHTFRWPEQKAQ